LAGQRQVLVNCFILRDLLPFALTLTPLILRLWAAYPQLGTLVYSHTG